MNKLSTTLAALGAMIAIASAVYVFAPSRSATPPAKDTPAKAPEGKQASGKDEHGAESVEMSDAKVAAAKIELVTASKGTLRNTLQLNGILQPNQERLVQVTPRFPGIVREIKKSIGDQVEKGELLAKIESNQSLTVYELRAPIAGMVIDRQISLGEYASEQKPAFTVADMSTIWVDLSVYRPDLPQVKIGDTVVIDAGDGGKPIEAKIYYISPVGSSDTQSALARAIVANQDLRLRTGLFVTARLLLTPKEVPVAVKSEALQTFENRNVVFVREGGKFEARDVELGARDPEQVEILFGLVEGDVYAAKNSFVVKAEIGKGTADHD